MTTSTTLTLEKKAFAPALDAVTRVVERRNTIPILSHVLLEATPRSLSLTATDLDIEVRASMDAACSGTAALAMPAGLLHDIVRKLPDGAQLSLSWGDRARATLVSGRARFQLPLLPAEDFPRLGTGELPCRFTLPATAMLAMISAVSHCISTEETRYYLNGIHLAPTPQGLVAVATDGHRLAKHLLDPTPAGADTLSPLILPRKTAAEVARLLATHKGEVTVEAGDSKIRFGMGGTVLTSKLIDGTFPDYERVIPLNNEHVATLDRFELAAAVERVSVISHEKSRALRLSFETGKLALTMNNPDAGHAEDEIAADYTGPDIQVGLNSRYLEEQLARFTGEKVVIAMADGGSPVRLIDPEAPDLTAVIMPLRA